MLDNLVEFASYWWFRYLMVRNGHKITHKYSTWEAGYNSDAILNEINAY